MLQTVIDVSRKVNPWFTLRGVGLPQSNALWVTYGRSAEPSNNDHHEVHSGAAGNSYSRRRSIGPPAVPASARTSSPAVIPPRSSKIFRAAPLKRALPLP